MCDNRLNAHRNRRRRSRSFPPRQGVRVGMECSFQFPLCSTDLVIQFCPHIRLGEVQTGDRRCLPFPTGDLRSKRKMAGKWIGRKLDYTVFFCNELCRLCSAFARLLYAPFMKDMNTNEMKIELSLFFFGCRQLQLNGAWEAANTVASIVIDTLIYPNTTSHRRQQVEHESFRTREGSGLYF